MEKVCLKDCRKNYYDERCLQVDEYCTLKTSKNDAVNHTQCYKKPSLIQQCNKKYGKRYCQAMCKCLKNHTNDNEQSCENYVIGDIDCYIISRLLSTDYVCEYKITYSENCDQSNITNDIDNNVYLRIISLITGDVYRLKKYPINTSFIKEQKTYESVTPMISIIYNNTELGAFNLFDKSDILIDNMKQLLLNHNLTLLDVILKIHAVVIFDKYYKTTL